MELLSAIVVLVPSTDLTTEASCSLVVSFNWAGAVSSSVWLPITFDAISISVSTLDIDGEEISTEGVDTCKEF